MKPTTQNGHRTDPKHLDLRIQRTRKLLQKLKTEYYQTLQTTEQLRKQAQTEQWTTPRYRSHLQRMLHGQTLNEYRQNRENLISEYEHQVSELYHQDLNSEFEPYQTHPFLHHLQQTLRYSAQQTQNILYQQKIPHVAGLLLLLLVIGLFTYTGYVALETQTPSTLTIEQTYSTNTTIPLNLSNLKSLRVNGKLLGNKNANLYLEASGKRYLILLGSSLEADNEVTGGLITGKVVKHNQGTTFVLATDKETYNAGETAYVIYAPEDSYYSLYLTDPDDTTTPLSGTNLTPSKAGKYKLVGLLTKNGVTERLETRFYVKEPKKEKEEEKKENEDKKDDKEEKNKEDEEKEEENKSEEAKRYSFQDHCHDTCELPKGLENLSLVVEINHPGNPVKIHNLTYTTYAGNQPPASIQTIPDHVTYLNRNITLNLSRYFKDPENDPLSYSTSTTPLATQIHGEILTLTANETGGYTLFVYASDGNSLATSNLFTVTVKDAPLYTALATECRSCKPLLTTSYTETKLTVRVEKPGTWKNVAILLDLPPGWRITMPGDGKVEVIDEKYPRINWQVDFQDTAEKSFYALSPNVYEKTTQTFALTIGGETQRHEVTVLPEILNVEQEKQDLLQQLNTTENITIQEINQTKENYTVQLQIENVQVQLNNLYDLREIQDVSLNETNNVTTPEEIRETSTPILAINSINVSNATIRLPKTDDVEAIGRCEDWNFDHGTCNGDWEVLDIPFNQTNETIVFTVPGFSAYAGLGKLLARKNYQSYLIGSYTAYKFLNKTHINYTSNLTYPGNGSFSVELWMKTTSTQDETFLASGEHGGLEKYWKIGMDMAQNGILSIRLSSQVDNEIREIPDPLIEGPQSFGTTPLNDGQWHHLVAVRDRDQQTVLGYVDGKLDLYYPDTSTNVEDTSTHLFLGKSNLYTDSGYQGDLTVVSLYPYATPPEEIQQRYQAQKSLFKKVES